MNTLFMLDRFLHPQENKEEQRIMKKVKEEGVESLSEEEKKAYQRILGKYSML